MRRSSDLHVAAGTAVENVIARSAIAHIVTATAASVPVVTLSTPRLRSAFLNGGGRLTIANMEGQALDLAVTGSGTIITTGLDTRQLDARVIGTGALQLAGVGAKARLNRDRKSAGLGKSG